MLLTVGTDTFVMLSCKPVVLRNWRQGEKNKEQSRCLWMMDEKRPSAELFVLIWCLLACVCVLCLIGWLTLIVCVGRGFEQRQWVRSLRDSLFFWTYRLLKHYTHTPICTFTQLWFLICCQLAHLGFLTIWASSNNSSLLGSLFDLFQTWHFWKSAVSAYFSFSASAIWPNNLEQPLCKPNLFSGQN